MAAKAAGGWEKKRACDTLHFIVMHPAAIQHFDMGIETIVQIKR